VLDIPANGRWLIVKPRVAKSLWEGGELGDQRQTPRCLEAKQVESGSFAVVQGVRILYLLSRRRRLEENKIVGSPSRYLCYQGIMGPWDMYLLAPNLAKI
jgi:hypothetical protein